MTGAPAPRARGGLPLARRSDTLTHVELTFVPQRIEHWIRFGRPAHEEIIDRRRRITSFRPGGVFAFVRWAANDFGTIISRLDIVRAVGPGEAYQTLPFVRPGGEILLKLIGWPKVEQALTHIDAVEALGIDPADACPDHWRHIANRLTAGQEPRRYTLERHTAWLKRAAASPEPGGSMSSGGNSDDCSGGGAMTAFGYLAMTVAGALSLAFTASAPVTPRLLWNASASVPVGLYAITPAEPLAVPNLVAVRVPEPLAAFLAERGYLARGVPLLKRVAALPGQTVCRVEAAVTVDGIAMGQALERDRLGRPLPVWQGCRIVAPDELFLMNFNVPDSFDGRYVGPLARSAVIGRAIPLYTDEDGDGRFVWRAPTGAETPP